MTAVAAETPQRRIDAVDRRGAAQHVDDRPGRVPRRPARVHEAHPAELRRRPAVQGLGSSVLPLALAAVAQAIVVISGGIDLSIGSMMALTSVVTASLMQGQSDEFGDRRRRRRAAPRPRPRRHQRRPRRHHQGPGHRGHPRDVVRVGRLRAARPELAGRRRRAVAARVSSPGRSSTEWMPKAAVVLLVIVGGHLDPGAAVAARACRSTRSAATSWRRSGAASPSAGPRSLAYALTGLFAALGGLALTASTGHRHARARAVHAAERRRGRARRRQPRRRPGRRRSVRSSRVVVLQLIRDRHDVPQHGPEPGARRPGRDPHRRGDVRQPRPAPAGAARERERRRVRDSGRHAAWRTLFRDRPIIPLTGLLIVARRRHRAGRPRHRQARVGGRHPARLGAAGDPRRLPDADHADRRHRPVGRRGRRRWPGS